MIRLDAIPLQSYAVGLGALNCLNPIHTYAKLSFIESGPCPTRVVLLRYEPAK